MSEKFGGAESYSLSPGVRYDEGVWYANAYLPILFQTRNSMARVGQMTVPAGSSGMGSGGMSNHMGTSGGGMSGGIRPALGDLYWNGGYRIFAEEDILPAVWLTAQTKAPTAMSGFGTGAWDFGGGAGLKKTFGSFLSFLDLAYLVTGTAYRDPLIYGFGAGPVLGDGLWSILLYYQGSTPVLDGLAGQSQLSAGANLRTSEDFFLSATVARGFSDSVPEMSAAAGASVYLR
ncbi:MAG: hypothetical protein HYW49_09470 [Deltaproteobacteria bacterium]|nr:hypothetical protein [Deltaproteobacteria bacterium]